ncbi:hypothetical protein L1871_18315 [Aeromonas caviae]|nr:hypothetical protein [Aeromonas caviae]UJQ36265.1 hypothetical protein L1871_18315 [Aeromonas caviae]
MKAKAGCLAGNWAGDIARRRVSMSGAICRLNPPLAHSQTHHQKQETII